MCESWADRDELCAWDVVAGMHANWIGDPGGIACSDGAGDECAELGVVPSYARLLTAVFAAVLDDALESVKEVLRVFHGKHNGIASSANVFSYLDETTSVVFFEIKKENFSVADDFLAVQRRSAALRLVTIPKHAHFYLPFPLDSVFLVRR